MPHNDGTLEKVEWGQPGASAREAPAAKSKAPAAKSKSAAFKSAASPAGKGVGKAAAASPTVVAAIAKTPMPKLPTQQYVVNSREKHAKSKFPIIVGFCFL